jgi:hypothetical protein
VDSRGCFGALLVQGSSRSAWKRYVDEYNENVDKQSSLDKYFALL